MIKKGQILSILAVFVFGPLSGQTYIDADFNSGLPGNWNIQDQGNSSETWKNVPDYIGNDLDGTPFMHVNSDQAGAGDTLVEKLVSPVVNIASANNPMLVFDHYFTNLSSEEGKVEVWDGTQWVEVRNFTNDKGGWGSPANVKVDLDPYKNNSLKVRFHYKDHGVWGRHWSVDNVVIKNKQCFDPTNLEVIQVNANSAYVTWDSPYPNADWQLRFGPSGFSPGNGDTVLSSNDTAAIGPLNPNTEYDVYVRELCVNGNVSDWVGPETFKTRCNTTAPPYMEDMESFSTSFDATGYDCWVPDPGNTSSPYRWNPNSGSTGSFNTGPDFDHTTGTTSGIYAYTEASDGGSGDVATLSSSKIDLSTTKHPVMTFWYHRYGSSMGDLHVDVSTDNGKSWDKNVMPTLTGEQQNSTSDPWKEAYVDLSSYSGDVIMVRFRAVHGGGLSGDMAIDDIEIREASDRDLKLASFISPTIPDCFSSSHPVQVPLVNGGLDSLDLSKTNVTVTVEVTGVINQTLSTTLTNNSLNGGQPLGTSDSVIVTVGSVNMTSNGFYNFKGYIDSVKGDTMPINDTTSNSLFVEPVSGGIVSGGGIYCKGDSATLSLSNHFGTIQWQTNDGSGWTNVPATGTDSTTLTLKPTDTTYIRAEVCGSALSSTDTVYIEDPATPTAVNDTFCKGIDPTAQLGAQGSGEFIWYSSPTSDQTVGSGPSITVSVQYVDVTYWVSRADSLAKNPILISEVDNGSWSDGVELQNVTRTTKDISGWRIIMNEGTPIADQDDEYTFSGSLAGEDQIRVGEANSPINLTWTSSSDGWVMLLDDNDQVRDMMFFGYTQSDIQSFSTTVGGNSVTASGNWSGPGIPSGCDGFNSNAYSRIGGSDNDTVTDWTCNAENMGSLNPNLNVPFGSCPSDRVPVTAYAEDCTGLATFEEDRSFNIFPNPAGERFYIKMANGTAIEGTLRIMDLEGRTLREESLKLQEGKNTIKSGDLADGVYMVRFRSQEGTFTKKLVIR